MNDIRASGHRHDRCPDCEYVPMSVPVLEARNVHKSFRQGPVNLEVLQGVAIAVGTGERIAIVGSSGSGKTTLLQILGGLDRPTHGEGAGGRQGHP